MNDRLARKYAYNISSFTKNRTPQVGGINFEKMKLGFYEEIESQHDQVLNNRLRLQKLKTNSIKDYIYSNKAIPPIWRNKLSYQDEVLKVIHNDLNFMKYLGNSTPKTLSTSSSLTSILPKVYNQKKLQHCSSFEVSRNERESQNQTLFKENSVQNADNSDGETLNKISSFPDESDPTKEDIVTTSLNTKEQIFKQRPLRVNKKKPKEKDIKTLLEEFRNSHAISQKFQEIIDGQEGDLLEVNQSSKRMPQRLKPKEKREIFNTSLYAKIIPQKTSLSTRNFSNPKASLFKRNESYRNNEINSSRNKDLFLSNNKVEITNPIIKKHLESINYYGPRYSYCSLCRNRNIEFYNELQTNNCLDLIKIIKKMKKSE